MAHSHRKPDVNDDGYREKYTQRGGGEKLIPKRKRKLGLKQRMDLLEQERKDFFKYLEYVENDKLTEVYNRRKKGWPTCGWLGPAVYKEYAHKWRLKHPGCISYSCSSQAWHYEYMVKHREKYLKLYAELEAEGIVPPLPF